MRIAVMVSGISRGSNLHALIEACSSGEIRGEIGLVIGTRQDSPALQRARDHNTKVLVISPRQHADEERSYVDTVLKALGKQEINLICLAGYMLHLPPAIITAYPYRILNIHPSLLPLFGGKGMYGERVHQAVLESGMKVTGCTVHFVDNEYDTGPILLQKIVSVEDEDTPQSLAAKVIQEEHKAYIEAVNLVSSGNFQILDNRVIAKT